MFTKKLKVDIMNYYCDCQTCQKKSTFGAMRKVEVNKDETCKLCGYYAVKSEDDLEARSENKNSRKEGQTVRGLRFNKWNKRARMVEYPDPIEFARRAGSGWSDNQLDASLNRWKNTGTLIGTLTANANPIKLSRDSVNVGDFCEYFENVELTYMVK